MICMAIFGNKKDEAEIILRTSKNILAHISEKKLNAQIALQWEECQKKIYEMDFVNIAVLDVTMNQGIAMAKEVRGAFPETDIVILADETLSPKKYMIPSIRSTSLLFRPLEEAEIEETMKEFFWYYLGKEKNDEEDKILYIDKKEERINIPYSQIYYIEAREKKVFVRTKMTEYSTNETLEALESRLGTEFFRCHRSYLVNTQKIYKIGKTDHQIYLINDIKIPVSRRYKVKLKEVLARRYKVKLKEVLDGR